MTPEQMTSWLRSFPTEPYTGQFDQYGYKKSIPTGTIIHTKDGEVYLVGDANALFGVCDDCTAFNLGDIVAISRIEV